MQSVFIAMTQFYTVTNSATLLNRLLQFFLQPLTDIYLLTNFSNPDSMGRIQYVYVFSFIPEKIRELG